MSKYQPKVTFRISEKDLQKVKELIKAGIYKDKTSFFKKATKNLISYNRIYFEAIHEVDAIEKRTGGTAAE